MKGRRRDVLAFDLDGTLVDFERSELACLARILMELGERGAGHEGALRRALHQGWRAMGGGETGDLAAWRSFVGPALRTAGITPTDAVLALVARRYEAGCLEEIALFPEVAAALATAGQARLVVMTNGPAWMQRERLERTGLSGVFQDVFISEEIGAPKPHPVFFAAVASAGYTLGQVALFGDDLAAEVAGGRDFGIADPWVNRHEVPLPTGLAAPDAEGRDLAEAMDQARTRGLIP